MFNGEGYHYWKTRMQIFKEAIDLKIWEAIKFDSSIPTMVERMQTQFYTGSAKSVPTFSTQATHLRFSTPFVKICLQSLNHIRTTHPLCLGILTT